MTIDELIVLSLKQEADEICTPQVREEIWKYLQAGTLFMDYRCGKDFSPQNTIIYGHHIKNGSMFGELNKFKDKAFFAENKTGTVYLP